MAFIYTGGSGLFDHLGDLLKAFNIGSVTGRLVQQFALFDTFSDEIVTGFEVGGQSEKIEGLLSDVEGVKNSFSSFRTRLLDFMRNRMTDRVTVIEELNLPSLSITLMLAALIEQMDEDSETINGSVVTIGGLTSGEATADVDNAGSGYVFIIDKVLDGVSSPGTGKRAHMLLEGVDSEFGEDQTVTIEATNDSYGGTVTAGEETFSLSGEARGRGGVLYDPIGGRGPGPSFQTINQQTSIVNGDFESFSVANTPDDWVITGTPGTHILEENTEFYRGTSSVEFAGDGIQSTIQLAQLQTTTDLNPNRRFVLGLRYKTAAIDTVSQTFLVQFTGTGYTATASEKISITGDLWATSFTFEKFYVNLPRDLPSDWTLTIAITGTMNAGKQLFVDDVAFAPVTWYDGLNISGFAGSTPAATGDRHSYTSSNDGDGVFSRLFTRHFNVQLPSDTAAGETIGDDLAGE